MYLRLILLGVSLTSCTHYMIRQSCAKVNWYQQGQDIAMRGERISNDHMTTQCRRAEAEIEESKLDQGFKAGMSLYCQPETVYQTGKRGDLFNTELCDTNGMGLRKKRHGEGIEAYCKAGSTAGLSGNKYKNVCPAKLEKAFMPDYRIGRKKYLLALVAINLEKQNNVNAQIRQLRSSEWTTKTEYRNLPTVKTGEIDNYSTKRMNLESELRSLSYQVSQKNDENSKIDKETEEIKKEIATLD